MPSDPERPIEKLLRAAAKERHDKAGNSWDIHPVNRRRLQEEVARRFGRAPGPTPGFLAWLQGRGWFKPLGASIALAVLLLGAWFLLPGLTAKRIGPLAANKEQFQNTAESTVARSKAADKQVRDDSKSTVQANDSTSLLADSAPMNEREKALKLQLKESDQGKAAFSTPNNVLAKDEPTAAAPMQVPSPDANTATVSGGTGPASAAPVPALERRYGLSRGLQSETASPPPSAAPGATTSSGNLLAVAKKVSPQAANLSAGPADIAHDAQLSNLAAAAALNSNLKDVVQYGYFAASQSSGTTRTLQQINQSVSGTKPRNAIAGESLSTNQILVSFRVEQSGQELRVIDSDGSVYAGLIQSATELLPAPAASPGNRATLADALATGRSQNASAGLPRANLNQQSLAASAFQVIGTNRSSNQRVRFSGTITGDTNDIAAANTNVVQAVGALGNANQLSNGPEFRSNQNLHLSGKAVIGRDQEVEIDAVPAPSPQKDK
jgi:hypothetical protein